jgi:hypothetical protein
MSEPVRVRIIICHRYHTCAGNKCFRALRRDQVCERDMHKARSRESQQES